MDNNTKTLAFTLVELIVVITILVVLGTIAFISFQGISVSARDAARINDIKVIEKGLSFHQTKNSILPLPDNPISISGSGIVFGYQGSISTGVLTTIGQAGNIQDPLDNNNYTYYKDIASNSFQLLSFMEKQSSIKGLNSIAETRFPKIEGNKIGILKNTSSNTTLELSYSGSNFNIFALNEEYAVYLDDDIYFTSSGADLGSFIIVGTKNEDLFKADRNLVTLIDYGVGYNPISGSNLNTQMIGNLASQGDTLECDGASRFVVGTGSTLLGGRNNFSVYTSYKIEKGENISSYPLLFSSYGISAGYNFACQHNLTDIDNPTLSCYIRVDDGIGTITSVQILQTNLEYGKYQKLFFTSKDGVIKAYLNGEKINEVNYIGTVNENQLSGLGLCARPGGGYNLNASIKSIYISEVGLTNDIDIRAFIEKISQE